MIGTILRDRYEIVELIGEGGMSLVYRALDLLNHTTVAVKVLRPDRGTDEDFVRRFRREAEATQRLQHPNLVTVTDLSVDQQPFFLVMEYVEGQTLSEIIAREDLSYERIVYLALQVVDGLQYAHENHIIHRDIKPQNILVTDDDMVKITDFGIAVLVSTTTLVNTRSVIGSVHYFSPEQARGEAVTEQSDLYSLGIVLYEMISGKVPFDGDSPVSIALKQVQDLPQQLSEVRSDVSRSLEDIVMRLLEKEPEMRYQSADDLRDDLEMVANELHDPSGLSILEKLRQIFVPTDYANMHRQRQKKRNLSWLVIILVLCGILGGGVLGAWDFFANSRPATRAINAYVGKPISEAADDLDKLGFTYRIVEVVYDATIPSGTVTVQNPQSGLEVPITRVVELTVCAGREYFQMPNVVGQSDKEARLALEAKGLIIVPVLKASPSEAEGIVLEHTPAVNVEVYRGEEVVLVVSSGPERLVVPSVVGDTLEVAIEKLKEAGLLPGDITRRADASRGPNTIVQQNPVAGESVTKDTRIQLVQNTSRTEIEVIVPFSTTGPRLQVITVEIHDSAINNPERSFTQDLTQSNSPLHMMVPIEAPGMVIIYRDDVEIERYER